MVARVDIQQSHMVTLKTRLFYNGLRCASDESEKWCSGLASTQGSHMKNLERPQLIRSASLAHRSNALVNCSKWSTKGEGSKDIECHIKRSSLE